VEELAWRRGVDGHRFVKQLKQVAQVFPGSYVCESTSARPSVVGDSSN
jgi:hypothetical protein